MRAWRALVGKLVPNRLPRFAAIVRALDHLAKPAAGLRSEQPVRIDGRALEVVDFPARKMRSANVPTFPLAIRGQNECPLACANQNSYSAHFVFPFPVVLQFSIV